jgi:hypothetical protein
VLETYLGHGVRFRYPAAWEVTAQEDGESVTITAASPNTSFWSVSLFRDKPAPEDVIGSALDAFRDEYSEVDVYPVESGRPDQPQVACDVDFVCFELINSAFLRAFETGRLTVLVLYQGHDSELETTRSELEAISASLAFVEEDDA